MTESEIATVKNLAREIDWRETMLRHLDGVIKPEWNSVGGPPNLTKKFQAAIEHMPTKRLQELAGTLMTMLARELESMSLPAKAEVEVPA